MATSSVSSPPFATPGRPPNHPAQSRPQAASKVRIELQIDLTYDIDDPCGADFVFNIHAAHTPNQCVTQERLNINQSAAHEVQADALTGTRYLRLRAEPGPLRVSYGATVDITHHRAEPASVPEVPVRELPLEVLRYIYPSRYCQSDRLLRLAVSEFGHLPPGYAKAQAICE